MTMNPDLQKLKESFKALNEILDSFKNSEGSDIQKDLKFYRTVYGKTAAPAYNQTLLSLHQLQEQLNATFLPKRYPSGNIKIFNDHQFEMIVSYILHLLWLLMLFIRIVYWIPILLRSRLKRRSRTYQRF